MSEDRDDFTGTEDAAAPPPDWAPGGVPLPRGGIGRVQMLMQTRRYADAEKELRRQLSAEPHDAHLHTLLAYVLLAQSKNDEATGEAQTAIGLDPEAPAAFHALASALLARDRHDEALAANARALRLDPYDADYHSLKAAALIEKRNWSDGLDAANQGLALDPEHDGCRNLRAMALRQLGRRDEAAATIRDQLRRSPDDAFTHANQGWGLLHSGDYPKALEHFREALRLDPSLDYAREGILEALKAKSRIYRLLLRWKIWMSTLSSGAQWAVIIGLYVVYRIVAGVARANPELAPFLFPVMGLYLSFVLLTWLGDPFFDTLLRFNRFGRLSLTPNRRRASNLLLAVVALVLIGTGAAWISGNWLWMLPVAALGLSALPAGKIFDCAHGWPRNTLAIYSIALALVGVAGGSIMAASGSFDGAPPVGLALVGLWAVGLFASWIVANALLSATPRR